MRISVHALERMLERGIDLSAVEAVLHRPMRGPLPGHGGRLAFEARVPDGRWLRVIVSPDRRLLVTAMWISSEGSRG